MIDWLVQTVKDANAAQSGPLVTMDKAFTAAPIKEHTRQAPAYYAMILRDRPEDRNRWDLAEIDREFATLSGDNYQGLVERVGEQRAAHRVKSTTLKRKVVEIGELRPTHFVGRKGA